MFSLFVFETWRAETLRGLPELVKCVFGKERLKYLQLCVEHCCAKMAPSLKEGGKVGH